MAKAAPADMPAVYTPMANEFAVPGNHVRKSFAELAFSAATPVPMKKLETNSGQYSVVKQRAKAPSAAMTNATRNTLFRPTRSASTPPAMQNSTPEKYGMDMIMENIIGSHWYCCMTMMAAPPGRMNANCRPMSRIVMPIRMAQRHG